MAKLTSRRILTHYWQRWIEDDVLLPRAFLVDHFSKMLSLDDNYGVNDLLIAYRRCAPFWFVNVLDIVPWVHLKKPGQDQLGQIETMQNNDRSACSAGHKVSKSLTFAGMALRHFATIPMARVPLTSATYLQVKKILWREIHLLYRRAGRIGIDLGGDLHLDPSAGLTMPDGREIFGFTTKDAEKAAGVSGPANWYLCDEASGIPDEIFEPIEGNLAGGGKIALSSQGTKPSGYFYNAFHRESDVWACVIIPSWHSPNYQAKRILIPGLATEKWVVERREKWGASSPLFIVRVAGGFPPQGFNSVFSLNLALDAKSRRFFFDDGDGFPRGALTIGCDPAFEGDDEMVIYAVRGKYVYPPVVAHLCNGNDIARMICEEVERRRRTPGEIVRVNIDGIGEGRTAYDSLSTGLYQQRANELHLEVVSVDVREVADREDEFYNLRTQLAFELAAWIEDGAMIEEDLMLEAELAACMYLMDAKGRYQLPLKKIEKKELGHSPDRRNALELAVYGDTRYIVEAHIGDERITAGQAGSSAYIAGYG